MSLLNVNGTAEGEVSDLTAAGLSVGNGNAWVLTIAHMLGSPGAVFSVALFDVSTGAHGSWHFTLSSSLSAVLGGAASAWLGTTAATGAYFSSQRATNFSFAAFDASGASTLSLACPAPAFSLTSTASASASVTTSRAPSQSVTAPSTPSSSASANGHDTQSRCHGDENCQWLHA